MVYGTYGTLNAAKDNAVLLPSHYMAQSDGYDWLIGEGRALDPRKHFLIMTELFGNGRSSSPSNTPEPFHGPRFPVTTIRDNVEAVRRLLEDGLGIHHLKAVVGFSMGAEQAFQWAVSHPKFADKIVATAGTARCWPHGIVRLDGQIRAITADPAFKGGDYTEQPVRGIETTGTVWLAWLYSQEWWKRELRKKTEPACPRRPTSTFRWGRTPGEHVDPEGHARAYPVALGTPCRRGCKPSSNGSCARFSGRPERAVARRGAGGRGEVEAAARHSCELNRTRHSLPKVD